MKVGDKVLVKDNLEEVMRRLKFDEECIARFVPHFRGTEQEIWEIYHNDDNDTDFATVDLCCEIPLECLEIVN